MSHIEDYNSKIDEIKKITDDQIKKPVNIPVGIYIQEAETLYKWCHHDKVELTSKGLNWKVVEDLPVRCGALAEAESKWKYAQYVRMQAETIWVQELSKGFELRNDLIHHFNYAFRDESSLIEKVKEIAKSSTNDGMIDGLYDLSVLGMENQELLRKIGFDFTLLALAAQKSNDLNANKEMASWDNEDYLEAKKIRDQAFTHLKEAVDLVYDCGKYVFCNNSARLKGYRSDYLRLKRMRWKRRQNAPVPEPEPGTGFEMVQID
jgi:hypothetical protein